MKSYRGLVELEIVGLIVLLLLVSQRAQLIEGAAFGTVTRAKQPGKPPKGTSVVGSQFTVIGMIAAALGAVYFAKGTPGIVIAGGLGAVGLGVVLANYTRVGSVFLTHVNSPANTQPTKQGAAA